jgi:hypothetical protein
MTYRFVSVGIKKGIRERTKELCCVPVITCAGLLRLLEIAKSVAHVMSSWVSMPHCICCSSHHVTLLCVAVLVAIMHPVQDC